MSIRIWGTSTFQCFADRAVSILSHLKSVSKDMSKQYSIIYTGYFKASSNIPRHNQDSEHGKGSHEVPKDLLSLPWCAAHQCSAQRQSSVIQFMTSATSQRLYLLTPSIPVYIVLHSPQVQLQLEAQYMWYNTCVITLSLLPSAFSLSAHSAMAKWAGFGDLLSITLKKKEILTSLRNRHLTSRL